MVHLLPYERYDLYRKAVKKLTVMATSLHDHSLCKDLNCCDQDRSDAPEQEEEQQCDVSLAVDGFRTPSRKRNYGDMTGGEEFYSESV